MTSTGVGTGLEMQADVRFGPGGVAELRRSGSKRALCAADPARSARPAASSQIPYYLQQQNLNPDWEQEVESESLSIAMAL